MSDSTTTSPDFNLFREAEVIRRAIRAYFRRFGPNANQPNTSMCEVVETKLGVFAVLQNVRGKLARYRGTPKTDALRFVQVQP